MPGNRVFANTSVSIMRSAIRAGRPSALQLRVQETEVERGIVRDQMALGEEGQHFVGDFREARLVGQVRQCNAMDPRRVVGDVAFGMDQCVEVPARRQVVHQFQRSHLDHPVTKMRLQACGFGVEQDRARHARTSLISRLKVFNE